MRVLGVDACKSGWVGVVLSDGPAEAVFAPRIAELVDLADAGGPVAVVAVDIPLGLPDSGRRAADVFARARLGVRRSSVFMTPVRAALEAPDHATAVGINRARVGEGLSIQAYSLRMKLFDANDWVASAARRRVVEVHPELTFAQLAGAPLTERKHVWAGAARRWELLRAAGVHLPSDVGPAGRWAAVDDVLDAAAAAWTARRVVLGQATSLPDPPEHFSDGIPATIWI